jgi:hypothetical protein
MQSNHESVIFSQVSQSPFSPVLQRQTSKQISKFYIKSVVLIHFTSMSETVRWFITTSSAKHTNRMLVFQEIFPSKEHDLPQSSVLVALVAALVAAKDTSGHDLLAPAAIQNRMYQVKTRFIPSFYHKSVQVKA